MISRYRLPPEYRRQFDRLLESLDRGADHASTAIRRWSRDEAKPRRGTSEGQFVFAVLAFMGGGAILSALALIVFAPR
jgi:hypothetical protein